MRGCGKRLPIETFRYKLNDHLPRQTRDQTYVGKIALRKGALSFSAEPSPTSRKISRSVVTAPRMRVSSWSQRRRSSQPKEQGEEEVGHVRKALSRGLICRGSQLLPPQ